LNVRDRLGVKTIVIGCQPVTVPGNAGAVSRQSVTVRKSIRKTLSNEAATVVSGEQYAISSRVSRKNIASYLKSGEW